MRWGIEITVVSVAGTATPSRGDPQRRSNRHLGGLFSPATLARSDWIFHISTRDDTRKKKLGVHAGALQAPQGKGNWL